MKKLFPVSAIAFVVASTLSGCTQESETQASLSTQPNIQTQLSATDAETFLKNVEKELIQLNLEVNRAEWIYTNFITEDTAALSAQASQKITEAMVKFAMEAAKFDTTDVSSDQRRKLNVLKQSLVMPAPQDPAKSAELAQWFIR